MSGAVPPLPPVCLNAVDWNACTLISTRILTYCLLRFSVSAERSLSYPKKRTWVVDIRCGVSVTSRVRILVFHVVPCAVWCLCIVCCGDCWKCQDGATGCIVRSMRTGGGDWQTVCAA